MQQCTQKNNSKNQNKEEKECVLLMQFVICKKIIIPNVCRDYKVTKKIIN